MIDRLIRFTGHNERAHLDDYGLIAKYVSSQNRCCVSDQYTVCNMHTVYSIFTASNEQLI